MPVPRDRRQFPGLGHEARGPRKADGRQRRPAVQADLIDAKSPSPCPSPRWRGEGTRLRRRVKTAERYSREGAATLPLPAGGERVGVRGIAVRLDVEPRA